MPGEKKTNKEVTYAAASSSWKLNEKSNQHVGVARSGKWGSVRSQELQVRVEATEVFPLQPYPPPPPRRSHRSGERMSGEQSSSQAEVLNTNTSAQARALCGHFKLT